MWRKLNRMLIVCVIDLNFPLVINHVWLPPYGQWHSHTNTHVFATESSWRQWIWWATTAKIPYGMLNWRRPFVVVWDQYLFGQNAIEIDMNFDTFYHTSCDLIEVWLMLREFLVDSCVPNVSEVSLFYYLRFCRWIELNWTQIE